MTQRLGPVLLCAFLGTVGCERSHLIVELFAQHQTVSDRSLADVLKGCSPVTEFPDDLMGSGAARDLNEWGPAVYKERYRYPPGKWVDYRCLTKLFETRMTLRATKVNNHIHRVSFRFPADAPAEVLLQALDQYLATDLPEHVLAEVREFVTANPDLVEKHGMLEIDSGYVVTVATGVPDKYGNARALSIGGGWKRAQ